MSRYLITGIAGFIGSNVARALVERGHAVRGIDDLSTGRLENLEEIRGAIEFEQGDIRDVGAVRAACEGMEFVLHQAARASVPRSVADPLLSHESNVNGTLNVLLAARDAGVRRVVYAASSSAYGEQASRAKQEEMTPRPRSPYAVQKLTGEHYLQAFCRVYGMEGVCLRYFNIFGPRQAEDSPYSGVIAKFIYKMMRGERPMIQGDGLTSRDFTYIDNAVQANLLACEAATELATGRVFNIGAGGSHTLLELYAAVGKILGFEEAPEFGPGRVGDVQHSLADIERAQAELGYRPTMGFQEGLEKTVAWYVEQAARKVGASVG